jgi:hypothetical protein
MRKIAGLLVISLTNDDLLAEEGEFELSVRFL